MVKQLDEIKRRGMMHHAPIMDIRVGAQYIVPKRQIIDNFSRVRTRHALSLHSLTALAICIIFLFTNTVHLIAQDETSLILTQTYSDDSITFSYPDAWIIGQVSERNVEVGSSEIALDAPISGLRRGEVYIRILRDVGSLASASPKLYVEELITQATDNQQYGNIESGTLNGRKVALVTRTELDRSIERIIGIIDMGNGRIGGLIATIAKGEITDHSDTVVAILESLSATKVRDTGFWTFADEQISFEYPLGWAIERKTSDIIDVRNTLDEFKGASRQTLIQVVTLNLFKVDVTFEQVILAIESQEPSYTIGDQVAATVGNETGVVARYSVEKDNLEGLIILFSLFDGRLAIVNIQAPNGELGNYIDIVTHLAETVEAPATALLQGNLLDNSTFLDYSTADGSFSFKYPPDWILGEVPNGIALSNDADIANRSLDDLPQNGIFMLIYPTVGQLPFEVNVRTPYEVVRIFQLIAKQLSINSLGEPIRYVTIDGDIVAAIYGTHANYDVLLIAQDKQDGRVSTAIIYTPRGEMGLHQRQIRAITDSFGRSPTGLPDCTVTAVNDANARSGAGISFQVLGVLQSGDSQKAIAQQRGTQGYTWWQLADSTWVREDVVSESVECDNLPTP